MSLLRNNTAIIKVLTVFFLGIFILAFFTYFARQFYTPMQTAGSSMIDRYETNSTRTDAIEIIFTNVDTWIIFFGLIGLGLWVLVQSQKKGELVYAES